MVATKIIQSIETIRQMDNTCLIQLNRQIHKHILHLEISGNWRPLLKPFSQTIHQCSIPCRWGTQSLKTRFMGPTWGPSGADRTQVGPMLAPWTLLSGLVIYKVLIKTSPNANTRYIQRMWNLYSDCLYAKVDLYSVIFCRNTAVWNISTYLVNYMCWQEHLLFCNLLHPLC